MREQAIYITASTHALFPCRPFVLYLNEKIEQRAALPLRPGGFMDVHSCYVCAIGLARNAGVSSEPGAVIPSGHGRWGGPSSYNTDAVAQGAP